MMPMPGWLPLLLLLAITGLPAQTSNRVGPVPAGESTLLELGKTIERQLAGGQSHEYHMALEAGQYASVVVEQRSIEVAVAVLGPRGTELFASNSYGVGHAENAELIGDSSGRYRLRLTASDLHASE